KRNVIDTTCDIRKNGAYPASALAVLFEFEGAFHHVARHAGRGFEMFTRIEHLTVPFFEFRFVIERVHLARAAIHEELNDPFNFGWVMQTTIELRARSKGSISGKQSLLA